MAGRYGKPTSLRVIEGNKGKRALNKQEPDPDYLNNLTAPKWLPDAAKKVWDEIVPDLRKARMLSTVDVPMLCKGCIAIAQYRFAVKMVGDQMVVGETKSSARGKKVTKPGQLNQWMVAQSMAFKQAMAVFMQFGMSPAARTRLAINPQGDLFDDEKGKESNGSKYF